MKPQYNLAILFIFLTSIVFGQTGNVRHGTGAGVSTSSADYNVMVGDSAATNLSTSLLNVFIGRRAGLNINEASTSQANYNVFLGADAGYNNTTADENVFIGYLAGYSNLIGTDNVFIGKDAGRLNTATDNVFIGTEAGENNTTGYDNTFIGEEAGFNNTTGRRNTFVGEDAGYSNTTGHQNTAIGRYSGQDLTEGKYNTYVGDSSGVDNSKGHYNTFIGQAAGAATEKTSGNTFVGFRAGYDNNRTNETTNAKENTYLGYRAGYANREGSYNVILGSRADFKTVGYTKNNYNVAIGYDTEIGGSYPNGKDNSIVIGAFAKVNANNAIAIGYNTNATIDSTMVLGGVTNRVSVGIGTNTPNIKASLDLADTDKGFLINRVTNAQKTALETNLTATDIGLMVYDTDDKKLFLWNGTSWISSMGDLETRVSDLETAAQAAASDKTPQKFNYQTSLVDSNGEPIKNQSVSFRISILKTTAVGTVVYVETHSVTTTSKGLTSFKVGNGTVTSGVFKDVNWAEDNYFLKIEADVTGATTYQDFGTTQLISVPYALHARTADKLTGNLSGVLASKSSGKQKEEITSLKKEVAALKKTVADLVKLMKDKK